MALFSSGKLGDHLVMLPGKGIIASVPGHAPSDVGVVVQSCPVQARGLNGRIIGIRGDTARSRTFAEVGVAIDEPVTDHKSNAARGIPQGVGDLAPFLEV